MSKISSVQCCTVVEASLSFFGRSSRTLVGPNPLSTAFSLKKMNSLFDQVTQHLSRVFAQSDVSGESDEATLAEEFVENRKRRERLFRLANTIHHNPNDIEALGEYVGLVLDPTGQGTGEVLAETLERCDQMEGLLLDQARRADTERVEDILKLADELDDIRRSVLEAAEATPEQPLPSEDQEILETLQAWLAAGTPLDLPPEPEGVREALQEARDVRALLNSRDEPHTLDGLNDWIERLQTAQEVDRLLGEAEQTIDAALDEEKATEAAYILQAAENLFGN